MRMAVLLVVLLLVALLGGLIATRTYSRTAESKRKVNVLRGDIARETSKINRYPALRAEMEVVTVRLSRLERELAAAQAEIARLEAELGR